jgi:hypothetical protein
VCVFFKQDHIVKIHIRMTGPVSKNDITSFAIILLLFVSVE